jgi:hypothetical protein
MHQEVDVGRRHLVESALPDLLLDRSDRFLHGHVVEGYAQDCDRASYTFHHSLRGQRARFYLACRMRLRPAWLPAALCCAGRAVFLMLRGAGCCGGPGRVRAVRGSRVAGQRPSSSRDPSSQRPVATGLAGTGRASPMSVTGPTLWIMRSTESMKFKPEMRPNRVRVERRAVAASSSLRSAVPKKASQPLPRNVPVRFCNPWDLRAAGCDSASCPCAGSIGQNRFPSSQPKAPKFDVSVCVRWSRSFPVRPAPPRSPLYSTKVGWGPNEFSCKTDLAVIAVTAGQLPECRFRPGHCPNCL